MSTTRLDASYILIESDSSNAGANQAGKPITEVSRYNSMNRVHNLVFAYYSNQYIRRRMLLTIQDRQIHMHMIGQSEELGDLLG
jgi:hypothetical protein